MQPRNLGRAPLPGALFSDDFHAMMRCSLPLPGRFGSGDRFGDENAVTGVEYGACASWRESEHSYQ